jgi:hypothetical protein
MSGDDDFISFDDVDVDDVGSMDEGSEDTESSDTENDTSTNEIETKSDEESSEESDDSETNETETNETEEKTDTTDSDTSEKIELSDSLKAKGLSLDEEGNLGLKYKFDGKEEFIKLEELKTNESGLVKIEQVLSETAKEKQDVKFEKSQFARETAVFNGNVTKFVDSVNKGDATGTIEALASLTNDNPLALRKQFFSLMEKQSRAYFAMSDEERKEFDKDQEIQYHRDQDKLRTEQNEVTSEARALEKSLVDFQLKYKLDDRELVELHDLVADKLGDDITVEALETQHISSMTQDKASGLLEQVDPSLKNSEYVKDVADFIKQNPGISDEEVVESIKNALDESSAEDTSKDDSKDQGKSQEAIKKKMAKNDKGKTTQQDAMDDSELDDVVDFDEVQHSF